MTSPYPLHDRAELRAVLEAGAFDRRDEGASLDLEVWAVIERERRVERAWGADAEQLEQVRAALGDIDGLSIAADGLLGARSGVQPSPIAAFQRASGTLDRAAERLKEWGMSLASLGADPWSAEERALESVVRVPFGSPASTPQRWRAAENLAPLSEAVFAFSPLRDGASEGWLSRAAALRQLRRSAAPLGAPQGRPMDDFLEWALQAPCEAAPQRMPFRAWAERGFEGAYGDAQDFRRHVASLSSHVLPQGAIALRAHDALPRAFWSTPLLWWSVLLGDSECVREISGWERPSRAHFESAARSGLADASLAARARRTFALVADRLLARREPCATPAMLASFVAFGERFALRGRTPADELMGRAARGGGFRLDDYRALDASWRAQCGLAAA